MRVIISPLVAYSVTNQADMIKKLMEAKGYQVEYKTTVAVQDIWDEKNKAFLWFTLCTIQFIGGAIFPYIYCKKPKAVYVTIEGVPTKANTLYSNLDKLNLIANSNFTKKMLEQAKLNVVDVIHHAVDWELCQKMKKESVKVRHKWEKEFGDRTKFIYVGRNDPRKSLDRLEKAIGIANKQNDKESVFLMFSEGDLSKLTNHKNVLSVGNVGSLQHRQVLALMGACDYLVFPSVCEGFGLPVLEANAMGVPVIHSWFEPLSEFSSKDFNFVFGYQSEAMVNQGNVQYWLFHEYRPELLAEMILDAVRIHHDSKQEYNEYCQRAVQHTKEWDYKKKYSKFLNILEL